MAITYGNRFTSLPNWSSSLDAFSRVQFNDAFTDVNTNAARWSESTGTESGTKSGFFHYNSTANTLKVYSSGETAWVTISDGTDVRASMVTTKGDLIAATAANAVSRLAAGTNNQALVADSSAATGLAWANVVNSITGTGNEVEVDASTGSITIGLPSAVTIGTLTIDSVGISTIQTGSESFSDNDTSVMTSAAVQDKILSYSYATTASATLKATLTTKGDLYARTSSAPARVGVGSNIIICSNTRRVAISGACTLCFDTSFDTTKFVAAYGLYLSILSYEIYFSKKTNLVVILVSGSTTISKTSGLSSTPSSSLS